MAAPTIAARLLVCAAMLLASSDASAQGNAGLDQFRRLPPTELTRMQVKITYLGWGSHGVALPTVLLGGPDVVPDVRAFARYYDSRAPYDRDSIGSIVTLRATTRDLRALLDTLASVPALADTTPNGRAVFALTLLVGRPGGRALVFEKRVDYRLDLELFERLRGALHENREASEFFAAYACGWGMGSRAVPTEHTAGVTFDYGGVRRVPDTDDFVGRIRLTNMDARAIDAPVYLVLETHAPNVDWVNAEHRSCQLLRVGAPPVKIGTPYVVLRAQSKWRAGEAIDVPVRFHCPEFDNPRVTARVFAGPGDL